MDKLLRESADHGKIYESLTVFEKSMISYAGSIYEFSDFIDTYIRDHFQFENKELFPIVIENGTQKEKDLIQELQKEHHAILITCQQFNKLITQYGVQLTGKQFNDANKIQKEIIASMLEHTNKEDDKLFYILQKYEK